MSSFVTLYIHPLWFLGGLSLLLYDLLQEDVEVQVRRGEAGVEQEQPLLYHRVHHLIQQKGYTTLPDTGEGVHYTT